MVHVFCLVQVTYLEMSGVRCGWSVCDYGYVFG